jgi:hypothetical protein
MTLLHPNLIPQQLNKLISSMYALRWTLIRTFPSCSDMPDGSVFRTLPIFFDGLLAYGT